MITLRKKLEDKWKEVVEINAFQNNFKNIQTEVVHQKCPIRSVPSEVLRRSPRCVIKVFQKRTRNAASQPFCLHVVFRSLVPKKFMFYAKYLRKYVSCSIGAPEVQIYMGV